MTRTPTPSPSLLFSCLLAFLLCFPFGLKLMLTEPYPAVIMPSGSGSLDISNDDFSFVHYRAYGISKDGSQESIDLLKLIEPAHKQYLYTIFSKSFGLGSENTKSMQLRGTDWELLSYTQRGAQAAHQAEYRAQLSARFDARYHSILLQKVTVRGDLKTKTWLEESIDENKYIEL